MALTARPMVDTADCLLVVYVDEALLDGAIGRLEVTNRRVSGAIVAWAVYRGTRVSSAPVNPGAKLTQTFRGQKPQAGDVTEVGYNY